VKPQDRIGGIDRGRLVVAAIPVVEKGVDSMKSKPTLWWMLLGPVTAMVTAVAMMIMFMAFLASAVTVVAAALTAYVKRDDWTPPAYRWTRDRTGRWRVTPWSGDSVAEVVQEETAD
jgi:hypothetical protein